MTISGVLPEEAFPSLEFLPISKGQKYIADLEHELSLTDGTPLRFVHDGQTGTSHRLICDAWDHYHKYGSIEGTLLFRLMGACVESDCAFRIWWASNNPDCHRHLSEFTSIRELCEGIASMLSKGYDICLRRKRDGNQQVDFTSDGTDYT